MTLEAELLDLDGLESPAPRMADSGMTRGFTFPTTLVAGTTLRDAVEQTQRACIEQALQVHQGSWAQAARQLGVDASNLHKLAKRLGCK
ncbi:Nitric oxide reductase transcription regulator NorR2 [compost metagenome]